MDWLLEHPQIAFLILLGIGSMVKSALEAKARKAAEREIVWDEESEVPLDEDKSYRKILPKAMPPPLPEQRAMMPPTLPTAASVAMDAAANEAAKALKHQTDLAEHLRRIRETKATTTGGASATRARIASKGTAKPLKQTPLSLRARLKDPAEVRRAFVMREILDPPVGLR